ncbi:PREDICTED: uncharacterized protein LOC108365054 [Rhagoletis zephyria]|uniref:uncharacterized protein LOC108365054 n=1 Tax=Rhagoletis zephyria TaxID=28612 RepID=UPI000811736D|nr:PREDICTED: uncharacterized protein LOC108365054 [Rhagoletis zephyria]
MMSIVNIFRRASNFLLGGDKISDITHTFEDNEVLFCKNNVCIHPSSVRKHTELVHFPGYLTVTTKTFVDQFNEARRSTLLLTWIPNTSFSKSKLNENGMNSVRKRFQPDESVPAFSTSNSLELCESNGEQDPHGGQNVEIDCSADIQELKNELQPLLGDRVNSIRDINALLNRSHITSVNITISNPHIENYNIKHSLNSVVTDINNIGIKQDNYFDDENLSHVASKIHILQSRVKGSPTAATRKNKFCRRFSVDLSQMRSLRLFFSDDNCTSGQLVIVSRESQYKILHFHYGGLDHLAQRKNIPCC